MLEVQPTGQRDHTPEVYVHIVSPPSERTLF